MRGRRGTGTTDARGLEGETTNSTMITVSRRLERLGRDAEAGKGSAM